MRMKMRRSGWMCMALCVSLAGVMLAGCGASKDGGAGGSGAAVLDAGVDIGAGAEGGGNDGMTGNAAAGTATKETNTSETASIQLEGLSLSILGDSISTFEGWIPEVCTNFYPMNGMVTDVSETWWWQLLDATGMELCANNSSAGCTCVGDSLYTGDPRYGCSTDRISMLTGSQGKSPDVIIVYLGTNDLLNGVPMGDNDGTRLVAEGKVRNFSDAYCLILDKLASEYPAAQIYCLGLHPVGDWGTAKEPFIELKNHQGLTAKEYSDQIKVIAENKGAVFIDLYHCGIEIGNLQDMTSDGVHFSPEGMGCVKEAVMGVMTDVKETTHGCFEKGVKRYE